MSSRYVYQLSIAKMLKLTITEAREKLSIDLESLEFLKFFATSLNKFKFFMVKLATDFPGKTELFTV